MVTRRKFLKSSFAAAGTPFAARAGMTAQATPLPANLTPAEYNQAIEELRQVVGAEWVVTDEQQELRTYRDVYSTLPDEANMPSAAVAPRTVEEIQAILSIARSYQIPLWTISTGKNYAYGGPAPRKPGFFVLDLNRMKRIIEVNEEHGYAVVEPGVSYFELYNYLQRRGSKLWIDPAAPGWGSVLGNLSEHGAGYTPYGDHLLMNCGMQVVLADGTVVDTGMGALSGAATSGLYKYGCGPWVEGMFTQSNFGIITKVGIWLMPEPPGYRPYLVTFPREEDLYQITEVVGPLRLNMLIPNAATTVGLIWEAAPRATRKQYYSGKGPMPMRQRQKMAEDLDIGMWNFYGALYGPEPIMDNNWKVLEEAFRSIPGAKFFFEGDRPNDPAWRYRVKLMRGVPNMTEFSLMNWVGSGAHIDFSPRSPVTGEDSMKQFTLIRDRANEYGFDYIGEFLVGWRELLNIFQLVFDRLNDDERRRAHECFGHLVNDFAEQGYGEYRTHLNFMDEIAGTYNWNDGALWKLHHRLKQALDPDGILSPGKSGIWPVSPGLIKATEDTEKV